MSFRNRYFVLFIPIILAALLGTKEIKSSYSLSSSPLHDNAYLLQSASATSGTPTGTYETTSTPGGETQTASPDTTSTKIDVSISGHVSIASGAPIPSDMNVVLYLYNTVKDELEYSQVATVLGDGSFHFINIKGEKDITFLASTSYQNIVYYSTPLAFNPNVTEYSLPITVYATTVDMSNLSVTQLHIQFDFSSEGKINIQDLFVVVNSGSESVTVESDGTSIPFIHIPQGAQDVQYSLAGGSSSPATADNGFALLPGADKQYGIIATYSFPYSNNLSYSRDFVLPVKAVSVVVPEGILVKSKQLSDAGTSTSDGTTYHLYQADNLVEGSTLSMAISGKPGEPEGLNLSSQTVLRIILGFLGILLIALGITLFLRNRKNSLVVDEAMSGAGKNRDGIGRNPDDIMDAIIALEDKYKHGDISRDVFLQRRNELKKRLKR